MRPFSSGQTFLPSFTIRAKCRLCSHNQMVTLSIVGPRMNTAYLTLWTLAIRGCFRRNRWQIKPATSLHCGGSRRRLQVPPGRTFILQQESNLHTRETWRCESPKLFRILTEAPTMTATWTKYQEMLLDPAWGFSTVKELFCLCRCEAADGLLMTSCTTLNGKLTSVLTVCLSESPTIKGLLSDTLYKVSNAKHSFERSKGQNLWN